MEDFKKILCEDLLIVNISVGTVYVSIIFLSFLFFLIFWQFVTHGDMGVGWAED